LNNKQLHRTHVLQLRNVVFPNTYMIELIQNELTCYYIHILYTYFTFNEDTKTKQLQTKNKNVKCHTNGLSKLKYA
jgi:hypothetical protein